VDLMAIATSEGAIVLAVLESSLFVAARARSGDDRRRFVHVMALGAVESRMLHDGRRLVVGLGMAADTLGLRAVRRESVTGEAIGRLGSEASAVRDRGLLCVAVSAYLGSGVHETIGGDGVACSALDIRPSYVRLVHGARPKLCPRRWDEPRGRGMMRSRPPLKGRDDTGGENEGRGAYRPYHAAHHPGHGPTPWQRRQGRSWCSSLRLEKPGPCGLPPGPPT
jgi:hypothetical protein